MPRLRTDRARVIGFYRVDSVVYKEGWWVSKSRLRPQVKFKSQLDYIIESTLLSKQVP